MHRELIVGRWLAGLAFAAIGFGTIITGHLPVGLIPLKQPLPPVVAGLLGTAFGSLVLLATVGARFRRAALIAALFPALSMLVIHLPRLVTEYRDPLLWSSLLQMLALAAGVLLLNEEGPVTRAARVVFATALVGFGVQHFMYPAFIAGLIPAWIPAHDALAWITGIAFEAAALSFLLRRYDLLAGRLLALMWLSWVAILHIPRIGALPGLEAGWTSGFIAMGLAGAALLIGNQADLLPAAFRASQGPERLAA